MKDVTNVRWYDYVLNIDEFFNKEEIRSSYFFDIDLSKKEQKQVEQKIVLDIINGRYKIGTGSRGTPFIEGDKWSIHKGIFSKCFECIINDGEIKFIPSVKLKIIFYKCQDKKTDEWYNKEYLPKVCKQKKDSFYTFFN